MTVITKVSVQNVRSFGGSWTFDLAPLTVLCGTNSAGKSTLLKVPLLLKQSVYTSVDSPIDGALALGGPYADLGSFKTLITDQVETGTLGVGLEIAGRMPSRLLARLRGKRIPSSPPKRVRWSDYRFEANWQFQEARRLLGPRVERGLTPRGVPALIAARFDLSADNENLLTWRLARSGKVASDIDSRDDFSAWFPKSYIDRATGQRESTLIGSRDGNDIRYGTHLIGPLPYILVGLRRPGKEDLGQPARGFHIPFPPEVEEALSDLRLTLDVLRHVGPLRAPARRYYTQDVRDNARADSSGERVPFILREQLGTRITFLPPGGQRSRRGTLGVASQLWLHYVRTGDASPPTGPELAISSVRDVAIEVRLRAAHGSSLHALVDSGFGYSQLLPIIVTCLLADPDATVLVEQPELHLNPALQVRLADFFVAMVRSGRQLVVETHSEHIVNALRVLAAEDESEQLHKLMKIAYLHRTEDGPRVVDLAVQRDGSVSNWPTEFFGEAMSLTSRLLSAQRRFIKPRG